MVRNGILDAVTSLINRGSSSAQSLSAENRLLQAIDGTDRGMRTSPEQKTAILEAVAQLEDLGRGSITTSGSISATWKLLWTTEKAQPLLTCACMHACLAAGPLPLSLVNQISAAWRQETLFILKNAGIFGTTAGDVYQARHVHALACMLAAIQHLIHTCMLASSSCWVKWTSMRLMR